MSRLMEEYKSRIVPQLQEKLGRKNVLSIPRLQKIVISMGVGEAVNDRKRLDQAADQLTQLSGQKAQICRAKKSVSVSGFVKVSRLGAESRAWTSHV